MCVYIYMGGGNKKDIERGSKKKRDDHIRKELKIFLNIFFFSQFSTFSILIHIIS